MGKMNTEEFIKRAKQIHGDKYDYSKVEYINAKTKVCIICPEHGEFWQTPYNHFSWGGCKECKRKIIGDFRRKSLNSFIEKAKQVHGDKYDYSKVNYVNAGSKICIICPKHGEFWQKADDHLKGHGCSKCYGKFKMTTEEFIEKAKQVHGDKYDYSKVEYKNSRTKVCIICPKHGEFWIKPESHINSSQGCPKCKASKGELKIETFLKAKKINYIYNKPCLKHLGFGKLRPDFYLPDYNLIIEYDGLQHFRKTAFSKAEETFERTQECDRRKNHLCEQNNIKLLRIPYFKFEEIENILSEELKL